ncbi:MAG: type II secretion system F family protein [Candidatus Altiarchaeota archaeon]|nr:type II secretion system F family protein [Candidatus Altiarchaeota archaeon]
MPKKVEEKKQTKIRYNIYLEKTNIKLTAVQWFVLAFICAVGSGSLLLLIAPGSPNIGIMTPILVLVIFIGFPILLKERRDGQIEDAVSDVFEELATSLRAGATIEQALVDLTRIQAGPLIEELKIALRDMEGGLSFEEALQNLIDRVDILLLKRIFTIVVDGRKAGGELADILDAVASDARDTARIQRERVSKTILYVVFIFMAGALIAPIIFAFVTQLGNVILSLGAVSNPISIFGISILWLYILIETVLSGIMLAIVRGDHIWRGLLVYSSSMAVIGTILFELTRMIAAAMLGI